MAAKRYLALLAGRIKQVAATIVSTGAPNDGDIVALDATGKLDVSVLPVGVGPEVKILTTSEALSAGDFVNVWDDAGTTKVRKADATAEGKEAHGFVLAAYLAAVSATVYLENTNTSIAGATGGTRYYLSTTPGSFTATPPAAAGNVVQPIGQALSATEIEFEPQEPITVA